MLLQMQPDWLWLSSVMRTDSSSSLSASSPLQLCQHNVRWVQIRKGIAKGQHGLDPANRPTSRAPAAQNLLLGAGSRPVLCPDVLLGFCPAGAVLSAGDCPELNFLASFARRR